MASKALLLTAGAWVSPAASPRSSKAGISAEASGASGHCPAAVGAAAASAHPLGGLEGKRRTVRVLLY